MYRSLVYSLLLVLLVSVVMVGWMSAMATAEAPCENEDLRSAFAQTFLPDCRAYEMVTPPYKEGYPVFVVNLSVESDKTILSSLGSLGTSGDSTSPLRGVLYLDMRTPSGWKISSLNAPSSEFVGEYPAAVEPISGETLWEQHTTQESILKLGLYARSINASPAFRFIGPLNIPFEGEPTEPSTAANLTSPHLTLPVAATKDFSHVIVEGSKAHWSFDETPPGLPSLYEYSGTDNAKPVLVGANGEEKGSTDLIGLCGTLLGGGSVGSTYNALSSTGEVAFFTVRSEAECGLRAPSTNEVYARINGALSDPGSAKTVDVSTSECTLGGPECADKSGKNFEGASENGQRVFFTSTQKLTNDATDGTAAGSATQGGGFGGCGAAQDCNLYEYRFELTEGASPHLSNGGLHLIAGGEVLGVAGVAEDGSRIYFVSHKAVTSSGMNPFGKSPESGQPNLYVYDTVTEKTTFIATLQEADEEDWLRGFSSRTTEVGGGGGEYLLFESTAHLTPDDTGATKQLFEYDAASNELARITKGEAGYNEDGNGVSVGVSPELMTNTALRLGGGTDFKSEADRLNMASDGQTVVFETGGHLSARATSAESRAPQGPCMSLYEFHSTGHLFDGEVHLVSDGRETEVINGKSCGAEFQGMDASGSDIMFVGVDSLLPSDVDGGQRDVYDARVDGGFAAASEEQQPCGASCEGTSSATPVLELPASASDSGEAPLPVSGSTSKKAVVRRSHKTKKKRKKKQHSKRKAHRPSAASAHRSGR